MTPTPRVICEICTADLGRYAQDRQIAAFVQHAKTDHPDAYAQIVAAYDEAKRHLPTDGLVL